MKAAGYLRAVGDRALQAAAVLLLGASSLVADAPDIPEPDAEIVSPSRVGEVRFPHFLHAEELGFECSECHHETAAASLDTPHDGYFEECENRCNSCHREDGEMAPPQSCGRCHGAGVAAAAAETLSAKVAIHRSCSNCHDWGTGEEAARNCGFCHDSGRSAGEEALWTAAGF